MNIRLLKLIRAGDPWLRRSISRHPAGKGLYASVRARLRVFGGLVTVPIYAPSGVCLYIPGARDANSKSGKMTQELEASGFPTSQLYLVSDPDLARQLIRFVFRIPWALVVAWRLGRVGCHLDWINIRLILEYLSYIGLLRRRPKLVPVIISDTTPSMYAMWAAAEHLNSVTVWWQDDYHHHGPLRFDAKAGVILNDPGMQAVRVKNPAAAVFLRPGRALQPMRPLPRLPCVGVATNALFSATEAELAVLMELRKATGATTLEVRLHPRVRKGQLKAQPEWLVVANAGESLQEFARRIDLAIVGNSASQIGLLCEGVPVLHVAGLDELEFDFYGYCRDRICFGVKSVNEIDINSLDAFYANQETRHLLSCVTGYISTNELEPIDGLRSWLFNEESKAGQ